MRHSHFSLCVAFWKFGVELHPRCASCAHVSCAVSQAPESNLTFFLLGSLAVAMTKTEGKRSTEDEGDAGSVASKRAKIDGSDASAAPTPARSDPAVEV